MRILIADDHALFRDSLRSLLEARGYDVVGEARNGREAVDLCRTLKPEVVLMDLAMPEMDGLAATRELATHQPDVKVVVLTASAEDEELFEAIKAGAQGYVLKNLESGPFFELLNGVERGEPALTPSLARKVLRELAHPSRGAKDDPDALTEREQEVLECLVKGVTSNRQLAHELGVSENTVKFHVRNILDKLHLNNRAQAVGYALRNRLVDPAKST
jgi:DNA-binding NarL/FixJ family response regulator